MSLWKNKKLWAATGVAGCLGMMFVMLLIVIGGVAVWAISSNESLAAQGGAVTLRGQIMDEQTQQPLERALFLVLKPGVTYQQFLDVTEPKRRAGLIQGGSYTDAYGAYDVADIPRGNQYTLIAVADGYAPFGADHALEINSSHPGVTMLTPVSLRREGTAGRHDQGGTDPGYAMPQGPSTGSASAAYVTLQGHIVDAATGYGIPDAMYVVLKPGITEEQFRDAATDGTVEPLLAGYGVADAQGAYRIENLQRGSAYITMAGATGYEPIFFAAMHIDDAFPQAAQMNAIQLRRE